MENEIVGQTGAAFEKGESRATIFKFIKLSGLAAILTGLLSLGLGVFDAARIVLEVAPTALIEGGYFLSTFLTLVALTGIYLYQKKKAGILNLIGYGIAMIANLLMLVGEPFLGEEIVLTAGGSLYAFGMIILAIGTFKPGRFPRWIPALWIITPLIGLPGWFMGDTVLAALLLFLGTTAFGAAFMGAGVVMWKQ
jgi:hypothetical protein